MSLSRHSQWHLLKDPLLQLCGERLHFGEPQAVSVRSVRLNHRLHQPIEYVETFMTNQLRDGPQQ